MCRCFRSNSTVARYKCTLCGEIVMTLLIVFYYSRIIGREGGKFEALPWNFHAYFGTQVSFLIVLTLTRRYEIYKLSVLQLDENAGEQMELRVLFFDAVRCLAFLINDILTFALFKVHELLELGYEVEAFWNWGLYAYLIYGCFIGFLYTVFILCDVFAEFKRWRKRVLEQQQ